MADEIHDLTSTFQAEIAKLSGCKVFGAEFLQEYGAKQWTEDGPNRKAAHQFRTALISRIATARLPYGSGTERRALESLVELFKNARVITSENIGCGTFEILVWHALNVVVRPLTAKWHPLSEAGALDALDATDDFRAELYEVQRGLRELERALSLLEGAVATYDPSISIPYGGAERVSPQAVWRPAGDVTDFAEVEQQAVLTRRDTYSVKTGKDCATGLALSGGGIRSATFSLGVLAALARRDLLPQFDYLSTVSGGGYTGCFLTSLLNTHDLPDEMGLTSEQQPFKRTGQESSYLMGVRQRASFLSGGSLERLLLVMRSVYGIFVNVLLVFSALAFFSAIESSLRKVLDHNLVSSSYAWACPLIAILLLSIVTRAQKLRLNELNWIHFSLGALFCLPLVWEMLHAFHELLKSVSFGDGSPGQLLTHLSGSLLLGGISIAILGAICAVFVKLRSVAALMSTAVFLLVIEHLFFIVFSGSDLVQTVKILAIASMAVTLLWLWIDVNETSLHRYYRSKLATAFIHVPANKPPLKLSQLQCGRSFYPIINCALNAPGSRQPQMRGRLADVFSFTPHMTGSNLLDYSETLAWEECNPLLDIASAMALSGAAVSPQMGLRTTRPKGFWLTLMNARLNAWLRNPRKVTRKSKPSSHSFFKREGPGLGYLVHEFRGTANEDLPFANISDGGHIENLGIYELLKRRCRYILAVDGESDPGMTFHALTNLQRLAYIDMGIHIDADLDELRLQITGLSRSHFRFCKIRYPTGDKENPWEIGNLLYVKLSLTGNEGEFLKRYRLDEPMFPHHSTSDQFFSETQFEAYRALGEHVGEKLFMKAIIEELAVKQSIKLAEWFDKYANSFPVKTPVSQQWEFQNTPNTENTK